MKSLFFLLFLFVINIVSSQIVVVEYLKTDEADIYNNENFCQLIIEKNSSFFIANYNQLIPSTVFFDENENLRGETKKIKKRIYKDFDKKHIYSPSEIAFINSELIVDSLDLFSWKLIDEEKEILGYLCKGAKTNFRGREYTVFYSEAICISDGPGKFNGLPGLILEVVESKNRVSYTARSIEFPKINNYISKDFELSKSMTWSNAIQEASINYNLKNEQIKLLYNSNVHSNFSNNIEVFDLNIVNDSNQRFIIDYEVFVEFESLDANGNKIMEETIPSTFQLNVDGFKSNYIYKEKLDNKQFNTSFGYISSAGNFYKDYISQEYLENKRIGGKTFLVKDSLHMLNWNIDRSSTKIILGYNCTRATLVFDNYNIEAWYTSDIFSTSGPEKYGYLPGLILEVKEKFNKNNLTEIKYYKVINIINDSSLEILPQKSKLKPISLKEYEKVYQQFSEKMKMMYSEDVDISD